MRISIVLLLALFISACGENKTDSETSFSGSTMGTTFSVKVINIPEKVTAEEISKGISETLKDVNSKMSLWEQNSEIILFNENNTTEWQPVSKDLYFVSNAAHKISEMTSGYFDVTLEPLIKLWGFSTEDPNQSTPRPEDIKKALQKIGYEKISYQLNPPALKKEDPDITINLSAIAKGFGIDQISNYIEDLGIENYMVEIGGDLRAKGQNAQGNAWRIAIEKPEYFTRNVHRIIDIDRAGVATSGDYRNYIEKDGERFSHIIDATSGRPITHKLASVTVLSDNAMMADGLATALLAMGEEKGFQLAQDQNIAAFFIVREGDKFIELKSSSFDNYIHTADQAN